MCTGYYAQGAYGYNGLTALSSAYNYYPTYNYGVGQYYYNGNTVYNYQHNKCYDNVEHCEQYAEEKLASVEAVAPSDNEGDGSVPLHELRFSSRA